MRHNYLNVPIIEHRFPYHSQSVLVFKTNIENPGDVDQVASVLNAADKIAQWNIALDDSDKILRITSQEIHPVEVISLVTQAGFFCEELPD